MTGCGAPRVGQGGPGQRFREAVGCKSRVKTWDCSRGCQTAATSSVKVWPGVADANLPVSGKDAACTAVTCSEMYMPYMFPLGTWVNTAAHLVRSRRNDYDSCQWHRCHGASSGTPTLRRPPTTFVPWERHPMVSRQLQGVPPRAMPCLSQKWPRICQGMFAAGHPKVFSVVMA